MGFGKNLSGGYEGIEKKDLDTYLLHLLKPRRLLITTSAFASLKRSAAAMNDAFRKWSRERAWAGRLTQAVSFPWRQKVAKVISDGAQNHKRFAGRQIRDSLPAITTFAFASRNKSEAAVGGRMYE